MPHQAETKTAADRVNKPRALVTLPDVALPSNSGRRLRSLTVIKALSSAFDLDVVIIGGEVSGTTPPVPTDDSVARWTNIRAEAGPKWRAALQVGTLRRPWTLAHQDWSASLEQFLRWIDDGYDFVWWGSLAHGLALAPHVSAPTAVIDIDDVESLKWRAFLRKCPTGAGELGEYLQRLIEYPGWLNSQREAVRHCDRLILSSVDDVQAASRLGLTRTHVISNTYPDPGLLPLSVKEHPNYAFVANYFHEPNMHAAHMLVDEVLPLMIEQDPRVEVQFIGRGSDTLSRLHDVPGAVVVGEVESVPVHLLGVHATLIPIQYGGGTRLKALEAMALGLPIVSTQFGVSGLGMKPGLHYLRAEDAAEFSSAALAISEDRELRNGLRLAARKLYEDSYRVDSASEQVEQLLASVRDRVSASHRDS